MEPLDSMIADVVAAHPEYHRSLESGDGGLDTDYPPENGQSNPFLHMGLHLAVREQVSTDRPPGIAAIFAALCKQSGDSHAAEHAILECLAESLWEAQRAAGPPDEQRYLARLRSLRGITSPL